MSVLIFAGCEATSTCGDADLKPSGWRSHRDTLGTVMMFDTISFDVRPMSDDMTSPSPTIRVFQDPLLNDSIRFELELETYTYTYSIANSFTQTSWFGDTLTMIFDHNPTNIAPPHEQISSGTKKKGVMEPQCSPVPQQTRIIAANVFIPSGNKATYIGR